MSNSKKSELALRQLLEDNFSMARHCRRASEVLTDASLKYYYQNNASRRSQFATELAGEISYYTGKEPHIPSQPYERNRKEIGAGNVLQIVKKSIKLSKKNLENYSEALCSICEGSCREILLRHRAFIENSIFELKSIQKLIKFQNQEDGHLTEENKPTG